MTEVQRFQSQILRRLRKFTWIVLSALYVAFLTALGMKVTSLFVRFLFDGNSAFAAGLEYCEHAFAILSFVASLLSDVLHQIKGTELGELLHRLTSKS